MKRHILLLVTVLLVVAMVFVACNEQPGGGENDTSDTTPSGTNGGDSTPSESASGSTPTESTPTESTPTESTPTQSTPTESTPTESTPTESTPTESTPTESTPTETDPAEKEPCEHDYNEVGICDECGEPEGEIDVDKAVLIGAYYDDLVNGGHIEALKDLWEPEISTIKFQLGAASSQYDIVDAYGTKISEYYVLVNGAVFAVNETVYTGSEDVYIDKPYDANSSLISGYKYAGVFNLDGDAAPYYGTTELITELYNLGKTNNTIAVDVTEVEGETVYAFTLASTNAYESFDEEFNTIYVRYYVTVMFTLGEGYNYEKVAVISESYKVEADADGVYQKVGETPETTVAYSIEQTAGARTLVPKYTAENTLATDFELIGEDGNKIGDTINVTSEDWVSITVNPLAPEGANILLDEITVESEGLNINGWGDSITFSAPSTPGTYTFTVKTINSAAQTYTVVVEAKPVENIYANVDTPDGGFMDKDSHTVLIFGSEVTVDLMATVDAGGDHPYDAFLLEGTIGATIADNGDGTYTLTATRTGTYYVTFVLREDPTIGDIIEINVETPSLSAIGIADTAFELEFAGFGGGDSAIDVTLAFGTDNVVVTNNTAQPDATNYPMHGIVSGTYNVTVTESGFTFTDAAGTSYTGAKQWTGDYTFQITGKRPAYNMVEVEVPQGGGDVDVAEAIDGEIFEGVYNVIPMKFGTMIMYKLEFNVEWGGDYYSDLLVEEAPCDFTYSVEGNVITITFTDPDSVPEELRDAIYTYELGVIVARNAAGEIIEVFSNNDDALTAWTESQVKGVEFIGDNSAALLIDVDFGWGEPVCEVAFTGDDNRMYMFIITYYSFSRNELTLNLENMDDAADTRTASGVYNADGTVTLTVDGTNYTLAENNFGW